MPSEQQNGSASQNGRGLQNQHFLESELIGYVSTLLSIHGFDSIKRFRKSFNSILFQAMLHPEENTSEMEEAFVDLQHISRFLTKLEEYEIYRANIIKIGLENKTSPFTTNL